MKNFYYFLLYDTICTRYIPRTSPNLIEIFAGRRSGTFIFDFKYLLDIPLVFLLFSLNSQMFAE